MAFDTETIKALTPVVVGGLIGIAGGVVTPLVIEMYKQRKERINLTAAIVAEVSALVAVTSKREFIEMLSDEVESLRKSTDPNKVSWFYFSARRNPFSVYDANLDRIGIIKASLNSKIVRFYAQAASIMEDVADMRELKEKIDTNREASLYRLEQLLTMFNETAALGKEIVEEVK